jgi:uncharacterized membrane protein YhaH (DUF805 family)
MRDEKQAPGILWLLFSPSGRVGRQPYFMSILLWLAMQGVAITLIVKYQYDETMLVASTLLLVVISIGFFVSLLMLSIKRLHDIGYSGLWALLMFVPAVAVITVIALSCWPSAPPNEFGMFTNRPK